MLHDPTTFTDPMEYRPERYLKDGQLNPDVLDSGSVAFGFGRRSVDPTYLAMCISCPLLFSICPGRHFSDNSLYSIVSCLLAVYDIEQPVDDQGKITKLQPEFTSGFLS